MLAYCPVWEKELMPKESRFGWHAHAQELTWLSIVVKKARISAEA